MDKLIIKMAGKHISENQEYYHIVFKTMIDDYLIYNDLSISKETKCKYNYWSNVDIVKSKAFGLIEEKYSLKTSSFENKITYINNNNVTTLNNLTAQVEQKINELINKCENNNVKDFLNFSINGLKNTPQTLIKVPSFVTKIIKYRDKIEKEKNF